MARPTPTSILFFLGLAACGAVFVIPGLDRAFGSRWWYWLAVPVAELVFVFLAMSALLWLRDRLLPFPERCPRCSGDLVSRGGGFYDGCLPSAVEFLLLILFIAAHVAFVIVVTAATAP